MTAPVSTPDLAKFSAFNLTNIKFPGPLKRMTRLRVSQVWNAFHGSATMAILGYKDADRMGEWVNVNGIELVGTDEQMVSGVTE